MTHRTGGEACRALLSVPKADAQDFETVCLLTSLDPSLHYQHDTLLLAMQAEPLAAQYYQVRAGIHECPGLVSVNGRRHDGVAGGESSRVEV
jgi:hypothetical protein